MGRWQIDDRSSRHVRRATLRAPADAPRRRLGSCIEEALRLASLPGESEGRAYYFQTVRVPGLAPDGERRSWLGGFQRVLREQAGRAVHGSDSRAAEAPAVYFRSRPEALEILLRRVAERRFVREWFWPSVLGDGERVSHRSASANVASPIGMRAIPEILEALRATPAEWSAVAAALFAVRPIDLVRVIEAVPESVVQVWLRELDSGAGSAPAHTDTGLPAAARSIVDSALRAFGLESPRSLWFAAMAVLHEYPAEFAAGTLLQRARETLNDLIPCAPPADSPAKPDNDFQSLPAPRQPARELLETDPSQASEPAEEGAAITPPRPDSPLPPQAVPPAESAEPVSPRKAEEESVVQIAPSPSEALLIEGVPTQAAGLFFLLNAMARLGLPDAIASGLAASCPDFVARLLLRLAFHSGIDVEDPVAVWLTSRIDRDLAGAAASARELRKWAVAVRRWCWRNARITVREIVRRDGSFQVNRSDLNVSLPLEDAEIRIRRVGLDFDPGWLPWFGMVIRFHYNGRRRFDA